MRNWYSITALLLMLLLAGTVGFAVGRAIEPRLDHACAIAACNDKCNKLGLDYEHADPCACRERAP